jgi:Glycosyltransferase family 87
MQILSDFTEKNVTATRAPWMLLAALLCCVGPWIWASRVLIPHQVADDAAHRRPRGNFSDLYPRWLGARELLLHGRDPYSPEVTREIQAGYYGRALDSDRPADPKDAQGFAYPVYVVFGLAPTVKLPFSAVRTTFFWVLVALTIAGTLLWMRILHWSAGPFVPLITIALTLGSLAVVQGLKLDQISLFVAGLIAFSVFLLTKGRSLTAGFFLAVATVKPQLVLLLLVWFAIWMLGDWRRRYPWCVSFLVTMAVLVAVSEWYLPHWLGLFWNAMRDYRQYADAVGVLEKLAGPWLGRALELVALAMTLTVCWRVRRAAGSSRSFAFTTALALASTVLLVPKSAIYNQILLLPAVLALAKLALAEQGSGIRQRSPRTRWLLAIAGALVAWPWIAGTAVALFSFISHQKAMEWGWSIPLWTALLLPVGVVAEMLLEGWRGTFVASSKPSAS